jgi:hypothetical protein
MVCKVVTTDVIFASVTDLQMKGADYCKFKYPWADQYNERFSCLQEELVDKQYLSSYCIEQNDYRRIEAENFGEYFDDQGLYQCYK